jgi:hypothetical protein
VANSAFYRVELNCIITGLGLKRRSSVINYIPLPLNLNREIKVLCNEQSHKVLCAHRHVLFFSSDRILAVVKKASVTPFQPLHFIDTPHYPLTYSCSQLHVLNSTKRYTRMQLFHILFFSITTNCFACFTVVCYISL